MMDQKTNNTDPVSDIQYPKKVNPAPSNTPKAINSSFPAINPPVETELALNASDWEMFNKIKAKYGNRLNIFYTDDILRFVQGYSHEKEREKETYKRIDELLKRGNEYKFSTILNRSAMTDKDEKESLAAWPVFLYGYDKQGHPVMYDEIGNSHPDELDKCFEKVDNIQNKKVLDTKKLKTFRFRVLRRLHNLKRIQTMRYGYNSTVNNKGGVNAITKHCIVMDINNFHAKSLTAKYRNLVRDIIGDESNLWPNTLQKMFIINAPWPFRFVWKIIQNFIHPITVAKIDICGSDYINNMKKCINIDQIPKSYGGTCKLPIKYGYVADIENDVIDGNYCKQSDPIDLNTIDCIKNRNKVIIKTQLNDDQKNNNNNNNANDVTANDNNNQTNNDDEYVKVQSTIATDKPN